MNHHEKKKEREGDGERKRGVGNYHFKFKTDNEGPLECDPSNINLKYNFSTQYKLKILFLGLKYAK